MVLDFCTGGGHFLAGPELNESGGHDSSYSQGAATVMGHRHGPTYRSDVSLHTIIDAYRLATQRVETSSVPP